VASSTNVRSSAAAVTPAKVRPAGGLTVASRAPVKVAPTMAWYGELSRHSLPSGLFDAVAAGSFDSR